MERRYRRSQEIATTQIRAYRVSSRAQARDLASEARVTQASLDVHRPFAGSLTPKAFGVRDDRRCRALAAASVVEEFFCDGIVEILKVAHRDPSTRSTSLRAGFRSG